MKPNFSKLWLLLVALPTLALAAPQYDPARVDGSQRPDPAAVFSHSAQLQPRLPLNRKASHRMGQNADGAPVVSPEDYQQAYGSTNAESRLGRVNGSNSVSLASSGLLGQWIQQAESNPANAMQPRTPQTQNSVMRNQLMPFLQDLKEGIDAELSRTTPSR